MGKTKAGDRKRILRISPDAGVVGKARLDIPRARARADTRVGIHVERGTEMRSTRALRRRLRGCLRGRIAGNIVDVHNERRSRPRTR